MSFSKKVQLRMVNPARPVKISAPEEGEAVSASLDTTSKSIARSILYGDAVKVPEFQLASSEKMKILVNGLNKSHLENLKSRAKLDYDKLSAALSVTRATLINKKGNEKYSDTVSERILAVSDLYSYGYKVFEDEAMFNDWMFQPNKALAGKLPYDIIDNQFGREEIKSIIGRIEFGVYS